MSMGAKLDKSSLNLTTITTTIYLCSYDDIHFIKERKKLMFSSLMLADFVNLGSLAVPSFCVTSLFEKKSSYITNILFMAKKRH